MAIVYMKCVEYECNILLAWWNANSEDKGYTSYGG